MDIRRIFVKCAATAGFVPKFVQKFQCEDFWSFLTFSDG